MAGGIRDTDDLADNHEINVTPFIDVMLVLLIIFMVAAPLATVDVNVDLPVSNATQAERPEQPVYVSVRPDLSLAVGDDDVAPGGLAAALIAATGGDREQRIFLRADRAVAYGDLMGAMNTLRDTGYLKIALVGLDAVQAPPEAAGAAP
ncbi:TonB system transport protein ExbD [Paracoccus sp. Ld10]|uniref:TonB system transport protein ExbD n=1 Tax=Paracoccus sp. Ld10 TaxID=649158 RepID=UPI0038655E5C